MFLLNGVFVDWPSTGNSLDLLLKPHMLPEPPFHITCMNTHFTFKVFLCFMHTGVIPNPGLFEKFESKS